MSGKIFYSGWVTFAIEKSASFSCGNTVTVFPMVDAVECVERGYKTPGYSEATGSHKI